MNIHTMKQSRFLTKSDVGTGVLATIKEIFQDNLAMDNEPEDLAWCIQFAELEKPMVLKSVNAQLIAKALNSEETDDWIGKKIVVYEDPSVVMKGKVVGGIRCRAPRGQAAAKPAPAPAQPAHRPQGPRTAPAPPVPTQEQYNTPAEPDDSDLPF